MELVKDASVAATVTPLEALKSLWPAIVAQVEEELKANRFVSLNEVRAACSALDSIQNGARLLLGMIEQHQQMAQQTSKPA